MTKLTLIDKVHTTRNYVSVEDLKVYTLKIKRALMSEGVITYMEYEYESKKPNRLDSFLSENIQHLSISALQGLLSDLMDLTYVCTARYVLYMFSGIYQGD